MKKSLISFLICLFIFCSLSPTFSQDRTLERVRTPESIPGWGAPLIGERMAVEYYIAPGDEIDIFVWKNDDLSRRVTVKGDGNISYPLIGTVQAAGLTVDQLREKIEEALSPYVRSMAENIIEPDDEIEIFLWRNRDLSRTVRVRGDGKISYPLIGTIQVAGLTTEQLQERIKEGFSRYAELPAENIIEPDDEIEIFVWRNKDLSRTVRVRGDGKISYPLIGTIQAGGLTTEQLQERIKERLSQYIKFPDVTVMIRRIKEDKTIELEDIEDVVVSIKTFTPNKISGLLDITVEVALPAGSKVMVFGEVGNEGIYLYRGTINLIEAIAMAGGVTSTGKRDSIIVVSGNMTEHPEVRRVNLFQVLRKGTSKKDILLKPNDVIYVPRTFIADINRFYSDIQPTLDQAMSIFDWREKLMQWYKHWERGS